MTNQNMKGDDVWQISSREGLIFDPFWASQKLFDKENSDSNGGVYYK